MGNVADTHAWLFRRFRVSSVALSLSCPKHAS